MQELDSWQGRVAKTILHLVLDNKVDEAMEVIEIIPESQHDFAYAKLVLGLNRFPIKLAKSTRFKAKRQPHDRAEYRRAGILDVDFVMKNAGLRVPTKFGVLANCASWRIQAYAAKGVTCVECGLVGNMVAIEKNKIQKTSKYHLNLYHVSENGTETMMTIDHIMPKSKGGSNDLSNLQTMCCYCNSAKGNTIPEGMV